MEKTIIVVTHQQGFEADPVIDVLRERRIPIFRFNTDAGNDASRLSISVHERRLMFVCDDRMISGDEIVAGWCQQLPPYLGSSGNEREILQRENLWTAQEAAFNMLNIQWLNKPQLIVRASNKIIQLLNAENVGLLVPHTIISNTPDTIRTFTARQKTAAKNLATPWVTREQEVFAAYTRIVQPDWLSDDSELLFCPVIYQEFHPRRKDYRVILIGNEVFAAVCEPVEQQFEDVRAYGTTGDGYSPCDFPKEITRRLRTLMKLFELDYCAADFIEDQSGNIYFLELNLCGAWWWLDRLYQGKVCHAIVDYLEALWRKE